MKSTILTVAALVCATQFSSCTHKEKTIEEGGPRPIETATVIVDSVTLHKTYPGYLSSGTSADVVAQVNGRLVSKNYEAGTRVHKGQVLFTIDATLYQDQVQRAEASLSSAVSTRDYAKSHSEAIAKAYASEAVSKMEVLNAESALQQAEANIKDCEAALHTARTNLGYCNVTAPIDGYITDSTVDTGNYISGAGSPFTLATIYDNEEMTAVFEIEDSQYEAMVGRTAGIDAPLYQKIPLNFSGELPHKYYAALTYEAPVVNRNTGTILLKGKTRNIDNELKAGMYVTIDLPYGVDPEAIMVEDASIGTDQLGQYVYVVNDSNKIVYTPVKTGALYRDTLRLVESGLKPGDRYVTKALLTVRNGETVKPVETE